MVSPIVMGDKVKTNRNIILVVMLEAFKNHVTSCSNEPLCDVHDRHCRSLEGNGRMNVVVALYYICMVR